MKITFTISNIRITVLTYYYYVLLCVKIGGSGDGGPKEGSFSPVNSTGVFG